MLPAIFKEQRKALALSPRSDSPSYRFVVTNGDFSSGLVNCFSNGTIKLLAMKGRAIFT